MAEPTPYDVMAEQLKRWRSHDSEGYRRFVAAFDAEYQRRLDDWIQAKSEHLAKFQGAALVFRELSLFLNHVMTAS